MKAYFSCGRFSIQWSYLMKRVVVKAALFLIGLEYGSDVLPVTD